MASETEVIRQQMEGTRTALAEKLEMLEAQVTENVKQTTTNVAETVESVAETVDSVKETVEDTVSAMKHAFDLQYHAEHNPWLLVGGSVVVGFLGTRLLSGPSDRARERREERRERARERARDREQERRQPPAPTSEPKQASSGGWLGPLGEQLGGLKALGIGVAMGLLRDVVAKAVPAQIGPLLSQGLNSLTEKLGGKPLGPEPDHASTTEPKSRQDENPACDTGCL